MNNETFISLKLLLESIERGPNDIPLLVNELKLKCEEGLQLIDDLRFSNNSPHVQLATRQSVQYINKALLEIESYLSSYNSNTKKSNVSLQDINSPIHAGLEIILNLNY